MPNGTSIIDLWSLLVLSSKMIPLIPQQSHIPITPPVLITPIFLRLLECFSIDVVPDVEQGLSICPAKLSSDLSRVDPLWKVEDRVDPKLILISWSGIREDNLDVVAGLDHVRELFQGLIPVRRDVVHLPGDDVAGCLGDGQVRGGDVIDVRAVQNRVLRRVDRQLRPAGRLCGLGELENDSVPASTPAKNRGRPGHHGVEVGGVVEHAEGALCAPLQHCRWIQWAVFGVRCQRGVAVAQRRAIVLAPAAEDDKRRRRRLVVTSLRPALLADSCDHGQDVVEVRLVVVDVLGAGHDHVNRRRQCRHPRRRIRRRPDDGNDLFSNEIGERGRAANETVRLPSGVGKGSAYRRANHSIGPGDENRSRFFFSRHGIYYHV